MAQQIKSGQDVTSLMNQPSEVSVTLRAKPAPKSGEDVTALMNPPEFPIESKPIIPAEQSFGLRDAAALGIRGLSAFVPGGLLGAAAGGIGEAIAQTIEPRESYNFLQMGMQAGLGAIPFGRVASLGKGLMKGAALGTAGVTGTELAETGNLPSVGQLALGAGIGGIGGGISSRLPIKKPGINKVADSIITKQPVTETNLAKIEPKLPNVPQLAGVQNIGGGTLLMQFDRAGTPVSVDDIKSMFPGKKISVTKFDENILSPHLQKFRIDAWDENGRISSKAAKVLEDELGGSFHDWQRAGEKRFGIQPEQIQQALPLETPVQRFQQAINQGFEKVKEQAKSYTKERSERIAEMKKVTTTGEAGYFERLGHLRGEYQKLGMPPLRTLMDRNDINEIYNLIENAPVNDAMTKLHAESGALKLLNGDIPQQNELDTLNNILKMDIMIPDEMRAASKIPESSMARQLYELTRGMMSIDVPFMTSAAFRQGAGLAGTGRWFQAYANAIKSFPSEKIYTKIMEANDNSIIHKKKISLDKNGNTKITSIAEDIGLATSNLKTLTQRDEQIRSVLSEKIPIFGRWARGSNRAYTAFINTLRTHTAEDWLKAYDVIKEENVIDMVTAQKLANTINELTGHGSLKFQTPISGRLGKSKKELNLERASDVLSMAFFSPRLLARDARMMNPLNYMMTNKLMRLEYLKGAARRASVWAGFTGLGILAGAEVVTDPTNSDFGKIKIDDTRLDAGTGLLQWMVLMGREALGYYTSSEDPSNPVELGSEFTAPTKSSLAGQFLLNRLHPTPGLLIEAGSASENKPFHVGSEILERFIPMFTGDMVELIQTDPEIGQIMLGLIGGTASMGTMTYGQSREVGEPTFNIPGDIQYKGGSPLGR